MNIALLAIIGMILYCKILKASSCSFRSQSPFPLWDRC
jgi:hypothetical protein